MVLQRKTVLASLLLLFAGAVLAGPLFLVPCSKTTCQAMEGSKHHPSSTHILSIVSIASSNECPNTCSIVSSGTQEAHVMGNNLDLSCRAWGGNICTWNQRVLTRDDAMDYYMNIGKRLEAE